MSEDVQPYAAGDARDDNAPARLNELRSLTELLELSQRGVGRELEIDERTVRYWFSGQYPTPLAAIYALRYLYARKTGRITVLDLRPDAAITPDLVASKVADGVAGDGPARGKSRNR
jgi:hypothetical protein